MGGGLNTNQIELISSTYVSFMRCSYEACYSWFIFMAYTQKCEGGKEIQQNAHGNEQGLQGHANMLITHWYKDSPLSEFGFCE